MKVTNELTNDKGGLFITKETDFNEVFTPEDFLEEHHMIAKTTKDFVEKEVISLGEAAKTLNYDLTRKILKKAGDVGLLGASLPEEYGGLGLDGVRFALMKESLNVHTSSLTMTIGGQVGIGALPIVFFGTSEQREKYLPGLVSGSLATAFALTEPSSGTDASGIKTSAKLSDDGQSYILNGNKVFITNAGFADIFVVFAKVNGTDFSAFIVERESKGLTIGPEEKKMGLKASSTCSISFEDVQVPASNLLGKIGKGHLIAFNVLNFGRLSVGANCLGTTKEALTVSCKYANQRIQFGKKISSFPLIAQKLADINIKTFVLESMVYRTANLFDAGLSQLDFGNPDLGEISRKAISEYMLECAINKVFGSETLDFAADEGLQIHGGYGYMQEYIIEEIYRDSRIKRIFEGTNEINRLFITNTITSRIAKGQLNQLQESLDVTLPEIAEEISESSSLNNSAQLVQFSRKLYAYTLDKVMDYYGEQLKQEQEISSNLADMIIQLYAMDSALLRTKKIIKKQGEHKAVLAVQITNTFINESFEILARFAKRSLMAVVNGQELTNDLSTIDNWLRKFLINTVPVKRRIADSVINKEGYTY
ncbi:acyl-CoA dehydrogenase family protein [Fredinandcohnia onubensis]|uniref:acyl-CoA dehydrogenase family protein n=1 Tax=Fredinandcohnia onubensis TaxID=1571209 RepID=UPI000C0C0FF3|nr:acyl-CoA dehydrogenase family protein [Fredinandcohnia onubensis]